MAVNFSTKKTAKDTVQIRYDCACGCSPAATYVKGSGDAGYEHCCCGIVHFAGPSAEARLRTYLSGRKADGSDGPDVTYSLASTSLRAPWGEPVEVAYAVPVTR